MFYRFISGLLKFLCFFVYRRRVIGLENVPDGAALLCCCHTSLLDPIYFIMGIKEPLRFMAKAELMRVPVFKWVLKRLRAIPVNRDGSDIAAVKAGLGVLKSGQKLFVFPEGTRVRPGVEVAPKTGAAVMAYRCGVPIVPMYVTEGRKRPFSRVTAVIGSPYMITCEEKRPPADFYEQKTAEMMERIFALRPES
ncbi:MAG: 1-acyl-sn-glycerol-3-phosphate acyltransferase [Oscillospiraceae bacterium]|nr:1-acyl-sn-glycerol-3-phosphate acyltransferase [Oscillospiraceae bacterium]